MVKASEQLIKRLPVRRAACQLANFAHNPRVPQVKNHYPRLALEIVLSVLTERPPHMTENDTGIEVALDAGHIASLLDAASSEEGSSGVEAPWADEACWRVYDNLKAEGTPWMDACGEAAEAALLLDKIANEGLDGSVCFLKKIERVT